MRLRLTFGAAAPVALSAVPRLLAGAADVDLTPPPGLPKAGYSRNARDGTGFRTRLRARVLHLRCGTTSLAVVATDLLGGSAVLQHYVAAAVAGSTDVPLSGLMVGATHTHGAPGQFHGTGFYNRFSSNRPGFDPDWASFLIARITAGVVEAVRSRRPARLGWGRVAVPGFSRNRSLPAYRRNPGHEGALAAEAVNPWLELLRVDDVGGGPIAALAVFSIHGTAVPPGAGEYNADLWSYLCTRLGDRIVEATGPGLPRPVVGALQGTHGDVTPALQAPAGHAEAARIGRGLGEAAASLHAALAGSLTATPKLGAALSAVSLTSAGRPAVGAALVAGARENLTPVVSRLPLFRAGHGKPASRGPQGAKWVLGSRWLQPLALPLEDFPRVWPVQLLRVGPVLLAGAPMELTVESGRRVADAVAAAGPDARVVVTSVANEYAGYCTTPPEYSAQFYEGGHTLYGPGTLDRLAGSARTLAAELAAGGAGPAPSARVVELAVRRFLPPSAPATRASSDSSPVRHGVGDVSWRWRGPAPGAVRWHEPLIVVQVLRDDAWSPVAQPGGRTLDDGHGDLSVTYHRDRHHRDRQHQDRHHQDQRRRDGGPTGGSGREVAGYAVRWHAAELSSVPAAELPGAPGAPRYRFVLQPAADPAAGPQSLTSPPF